MTYYNVTNSLISPSEKCIANNLGNKPDFLKKHVLTRGAFFMLSPASFITCALDTIIGVGASIGSICSLGMHYPTYEFANRHLRNSNLLLTRPFINVLRIINPFAKLSNDEDLRCGYSKALISGDGKGLITDVPFTILRNTAARCYTSDNLLKRHVASRLTYALLAISCVVTRVVDALIGIPAAGLTLLTLGKSESLNNITFRALQTPGIINDMLYCAIKIINPWAGTNY